MGPAHHDLAKQFTDQVVTAVQSHFGSENVTPIMNDGDVGAFLLNLRPGTSRDPINRLNDLHVTLVSTGPDSMDIHFGYTHHFNDRMFFRMLHEASNASKAAPRVLNVDSSQSTPVSRQFRVSNLQASRLHEQAELIASALDIGVNEPYPESHDSSLNHII